jgi:hypothetical protein
MGTPNPGDLCALYYNTGTNASPVWVEITKAKDVSFPIQMGEADTSARDNEFKTYEVTLIGVELTFGYQYEPGTDTVFAALMSMALARTAKQFAAADGPIASTGTNYLKFFGKVFGLGSDQPLDGAETKDLTVKPVRFYESSVLQKPSWNTTP